MADPTRRQLEQALTGRYTIERELGRGGMAVVYLAQDHKHDRPVAVKLLRPELAEGIGADRFVREMRLAARLHHPHILSLLDSGTARVGAGTLVPYYIMPFVSGESLRHLLERHGRLPIDEAVRIVCEVADGLAYAHERGVVHRDVKPENVLLEAGHALVADFGIARALSAAGTERVTATGLIVGTPAYMSPEQAAGSAEVGPPSDVYSLACVLYELLTGAPPFRGASAAEAVAARFSRAPRPARHERPEIPAALDAVLSRALVPAPGDRYPDAKAFADALEEAGRTAPRGRRRTVVLAGLATAALVALAALLGDGGGTATDTAAAPAAARTTPAHATAVAVLPFAVRGSPELAYLSEGMVDLLSTKLDGAGELRSVDPRALLSITEREGPDPLGPRRAAVVAGELGAELFVLGDVVQAGDAIQLQAALYRPGHAAPVAQGVAQGDAGRLLSLVDSLAAQLLAGWGGADGSRVTRLAALTTGSLPALKAYLEGERALRAGEYDQAMSAFRRAAETDTAFALAWYRLSVAAEWLTRDDVMRAAAERAARLADRLPEQDRLLLRARTTAWFGDLDSAVTLFRTITGTYPEDVEAWVQLGEVLFHMGPRRGRSSLESREAWLRVQALEPDLIAALIHLIRLAALEGRLTELDTLVQRLTRVHEALDAERAGDTRSELLELRALRAAALRDTAEERRVLAELREASDLTLVLSLWSVGTYTPNREAAERLARLLLEPSRAEPVQVTGRLLLASNMAERGRWRDASRWTAEAAALDSSRGVEQALLHLTLPFRGAPPESLAAAREALARLPPPTAGEPAVAGVPWFSGFGHYQPGIREYLAGLLAAQLGDEAAARRHAARLDALGPLDPEGGLDDSYGSVLRDFARGIRAELARLNGDMEGVLRELADLEQGATYLAAVSSPFIAGTRERWLRAVALARTGRGEEALRQLTALTEFSPYDRIYAAPSHLERARLLEHLGRRAEAAEHRASAAAIWRDADPTFRASVFADDPASAGGDERR